MTGIVYKYTSPSGKVYIGQTRNEKCRRHAFLTVKNYAGDKINKALAKYGPKNFKYEVLIRVKSDNLDDLTNQLNNLETFYIWQYDAIENGYNITDGGDDFTRTPEMKENCREKNLGHPAWNKGIKGCFSEETLQKMSEVKKGKAPWNKGKKGCQEAWNKGTKGLYKNHTQSRGVFMYDLDGNFIQKFDSILSAANYMGINAGPISSCCNGKNVSSKNHFWSFNELSLEEIETLKDRYESSKHPWNKGMKKEIDQSIIDEKRERHKAYMKAYHKAHPKPHTIRKVADNDN